MNRLLQRQLKKHLGEQLNTEACFQSQDFKELLESIGQAYEFKDKEVRLMERTIDLNSQELNEANKLLRKQNEEISQLATIDALTGLPNRHIFNTKINVSLRQLQNPNFISSIDAALNMTNLDPKYLEIELTESSVMQKTRFSMKILQQLKARGIEISIDDFGTGYSSLSHLKQFTINKLKIDQSFVRDIEKSPDAKAIIEAIIAMSHSLNLNVIAEGVESEVQLNYLREKMCDQIQGYWISRPKPAHEIALMLKENPNFLYSYQP